MPDFVRFTTSSGGDPEQALTALFAHVLPNAQDMIRAADKQIARIKQRTADGVDVDRQPFEAYSTAYAKIRAKKGLRVSPPDLRVTGELLDSMNSQVLSETQFAIVITDIHAEEYGPAVNNRRRFFDTSQDELRQMLDDLRGTNA